MESIHLCKRTYQHAQALNKASTWRVAQSPRVDWLWLTDYAVIIVMSQKLSMIESCE
jgi:hypothetical protein